MKFRRKTIKLKKEISNLDRRDPWEASSGVVRTTFASGGTRPTAAGGRGRIQRRERVQKSSRPEIFRQQAKSDYDLKKFVVNVFDLRSVDEFGLR